MTSIAIIQAFALLPATQAVAAGSVMAGNVGVFVYNLADFVSGRRDSRNS